MCKRSKIEGQSWADRLRKSGEAALAAAKSLLRSSREIVSIIVAGLAALRAAASFFKR